MDFDFLTDPLDAVGSAFGAASDALGKVSDSLSYEDPGIAPSHNINNSFNSSSILGSLHNIEGRLYTRGW